MLWWLARMHFALAIRLEKRCPCVWNIWIQTLGVRKEMNWVFQLSILILLLILIFCQRTELTGTLFLSLVVEGAYWVWTLLIFSSMACGVESLPPVSICPSSLGLGSDTGFYATVRWFWVTFMCLVVICVRHFWVPFVSQTKEIFWCQAFVVLWEV